MKGVFIMDKIFDLLRSFQGEVYDFCYEVLKIAQDHKEAFAYVCRNFSEPPEHGTIEIPSYFAEDEIETYVTLYGSTVNGLIKMSMKKCDLGIICPESFYSDLWDSFCKNFSSNKELAFAFYYTIIDSAIPYQYLGKTLSMSNEQFQKLTEENKPLIEKILYIKKNRHAQRTEEASLLLNCLDEIENREVKIVVLAHAITILGSGRFPMGRRELDSIIREIDEKIKELESKEDDE